MTYKFIFFPFTHITQNQLNTILAFFPSFQHLPVSVDFKHQPTLQKLYEQGKIHPFFSSARDVVAVEQKIGEYLAWARMNKGNEHNLKLLIKDHPYFTSNSDVTAIKSKILGAKGLEKEAISDELALQHNLLFLKMAQLSDEQNESIDLELRDLDEARDTLIFELRGLDSSDHKDSKTEENKDTGAMMTKERIKAWSVCMAPVLQSQDKSPLFVTTSDAVFEYIESNCKDVVNSLDIDKIKVHENDCEKRNEWQQKMCDYLMGAVQGDGNRKNKMPQVNDTCSLSGQIKLGHFSGNGINKLFNLSDKQIPVCLIKLK